MKKQYDVIVIGGGPSGITAALASGRANASTLLIERYGFLGGMSSSALVYPWFTFHDLSGNQVINGIAQEIVDRLIEKSGSPGHLRDSSGFVWSITPFDKETFKSVALDLLSDSNVDILLHSYVSNLQIIDYRITKLKTVGKYGNTEVEGKVIIDATGDADIAALSGSPCAIGRPSDGKVQAMTYIFKLGGVSIDPIKTYYLEHPDEFFTPTVPIEAQNMPLTCISGFFKHWRSVPFSIPRDRFLFFIGPRPGEITVNTTRILDTDPTRADQITYAEITGRKQAELLTNFMKNNLPGFENSFLLETPVQIGVRESRRIVGKFQLTESNIRNTSSFPDRIARCGYPIDIHMPDNAGMTLIDFKKSYEIPYRVMLPQKILNLLVTGRAVSSSHDAFASLRVTAPVMALGQAAGVAAAQCIKNNTNPINVDIEKLQLSLLDGKAIL